MVVNVASKCGYTEGSYAGAEDIRISALACCGWWMRLVGAADTPSTSYTFAVPAV